MAQGYEVFTELAEDYARYRPGYPAEMYEALVAFCGLMPAWVVADVGAGTGNLARLFLAAGHAVIGVEPNREMRAAGERLLAAYPAFRNLDGTAEHLPLPARSVELVTVGQALHWFAAAAARQEFVRVLRPGGWVAVAWNDRLAAATPFTRAYAAFTRACAAVTSPPSPAPSLASGLETLFGAVVPWHAGFPHAQAFDLPGLLGRARSSGYLPPPGVPHAEELTARLTELFHRHQQHGVVEFHYQAQLYLGQLDA